jgi:superfamily I DNA/RNA helicase
MAIAADVLAGIDPELEPPRSVREAGVQPWRAQVPAAELPARLASLVASEAAQMTDGRLAVIVPGTRLAELGQAIRSAVPGTAVGEDPELATPVVVLSVAQAKGLEFDSVFVADPARILADSPRGGGDLYVALTRATQRLAVVHSGEPPAVLARLRPLAADNKRLASHNG